MHKKALLLLFAGAAAAGVYLEVTRRRELGKALTPENTQPTASVSARAASASSPGPRAASREEVLAAIPRLEAAVRKGASEALQPWALAHGLVAFGKDLRADNGELALERIASFAEKRSVGGRISYVFPKRKGDSLVEPHPNLLVKTLLEVNLPLEQTLVISDGSQVTLGRLAEGVLAGVELPKDDAGWYAAAWTLSAVVEHAKLLAEALHKPLPAAPGIVSVAEFSGAALARLEKDHRVVSDYAGDPGHAFDEASPLRTAKEAKTGIYGHSCGGMHLAQAVISAIAHAGSDAEQSRVRRQLGVLLFRYEAEREAYARMLVEHPEHGLLLRVQQLKFFGHLVETLTLARALGAYSPQSEGGRRLDQVAKFSARDAIAAFEDLERGGTYQRLAAVRREREQTYLDLIGDGCHAIRGLRRLLDSY